MSKPISSHSDRSERVDALSVAKRSLLWQRMKKSGSNGADLVGQSLAAGGITHVYAVAGVPTEFCLAGFAREGIRTIGAYHQTAAVCMATAHNYVAGRLTAAALVSAGPAATNAITGVHIASANAWPVIVLGGQRDSFQRLDVIPLVKPISKLAENIASTSAIQTCIQRAIHAACDQRPGPVYLNLHEDALVGYAQPERPSDRLEQRLPTASDDQLDDVIDAILSARRPLLVIGKGIRWTVDFDRLRKLVELADLPFITSPMGRGFVPDDHPLCLNQARAHAQANADTVLILGARLNWVFRHGAEFTTARQLIQIDVDQHANEESSAETTLIRADAGDAVNRLLTRLERRGQQLSNSDRRQNVRVWHAANQAVRHQTKTHLRTQAESAGLPMSPHRMMKEIRDAIPQDTICVCDGNISMLAAQQIIDALEPVSRIDAGTNACMGTGIPFAIGAKIANPNRPVVAITGDFAFSLSAAELETCVRQKIPIVVIVANNRGNVGATKQTKYFPADYPELVTMAGPDIEYDRIMATYGGQGVTVKDPAELRKAVCRAVESRRPACINVVVDPSAPVPNAWGDQRTLGAQSG